MKIKKKEAGNGYSLKKTMPKHREDDKTNKDGRDGERPTTECFSLPTLMSRTLQSGKC